MQPETEFAKAIRERYASLPKVVQRAIVSADVAKQMRELADAHKLHLDQWDALETEVQFTLLGIHSGEDLVKNIQNAVNIDEAAAESLAADISRVVFDPVRKELERELDHPDAVAATTTGVEDMQRQELAKAENQPVPTATTTPITPSVTSAPSIVPGTPPAPAPTATVERAPISPTYVPATPSHERKTIEGDPYREQLK